MGAEQFDRETIISAIWEKRGKVSAAAALVGCTPETIFNYAKKYVTVKDAIDRARYAWDEALLDLAEVRLYQSVDDNKPWAVKYALDTKGKVRGYVIRQELTGADGGRLQVTVNWPEDDDEQHPDS